MVIWIIYLGKDLRALEPFEYYTWESTAEPTSHLNNIPWESTDEPTSHLNNIPWESTAEPTSHLNNIPWNRLTSQRAIWIIPWNRLPSQRATSIRIVGKVALYSVVKPSWSSCFSDKKVFEEDFTWDQLGWPSKIKLKVWTGLHSVKKNLGLWRSG